MRWVQPVDQRGFGEGDTSGDNVVARIVKYVPSEVIAAYTMLFTLGVTMLGADSKVPALLLIILFLGITIGYIAWKGPAESKTAHMIVGPIAFLAWAYPISSALLGDFFIPLIAFFLQAVVIGLSIFVVPKGA